jgi:hypothetical protein
MQFVELQRGDFSVGRLGLARGPLKSKMSVRRSPTFVISAAFR